MLLDTEEVLRSNFGSRQLGLSSIKCDRIGSSSSGVSLDILRNGSSESEQYLHTRADLSALV